MGPVSWILNGFNADPDPSFNVSAAPDPYTGSQTKADSFGSGLSEFNFTKVEFLPINYSCQVKNTYEGTKALLKDRTQLLISVNSMILDLDPHSQYGSGRRIAKCTNVCGSRIRIQTLQG
jgi:hypothetical protein